MSSAFCGEGGRWIKTCLASDDSRIRICDPCCEARVSELVIVPGDGVVTAHCDQENKALVGQPEDSPLVPRTGDLLVTRSNTPGYVGDVAAVTRTSPRRMLPDLICRLRLDNSRISAEFAAYALLTSRSRHEISSLARGSSQSMVKLRGEDIRSLPVPVVTPSVQEQVVASLEHRRQQNSEILGRLKRQLDLLTEHRQALITAAVTGQIEVPGVAAS